MHNWLQQLFVKTVLSHLCFWVTLVTSSTALIQYHLLRTLLMCSDASMLSLGKQVLQWMVWLPAGVLLQIYSVWSSLCGVHRDNCVISGTCSLAPIQSSCGCQPAWWQRVSSTMSHIDASLTLAQRSKSDGQCLSNSSSRNVKRWHRLQPWPWHDQHASPWCWPATDSSAVVS